MAEARHDHEGSASIGGRTITNLHFAGNIGGLIWDLALSKASRQQDDLRLSGLYQSRAPMARLKTSTKWRTANVRADSLSTVPPTPRIRTQRPNGAIWRKRALENRRQENPNTD
ncbi:hypothetical protein PoB_005962300 [Plakobranchus ocellatus]|uniref:Uncharacterized protein n=1 Tax=Plakobranchus ocellatus TaxID=259542 RepID=A0AAV4CN97_9GAST|nr:hypothetical protein PoB_005962300 [Plakobranchus ocellatus]